MTPKQIKTKRIHIENKIAEWEQKLIELQNSCSHINIQQKYRSDTGNWDRNSDRYWIDCRCSDCDKFWREDQ